MARNPTQSSITRWFRSFSLRTWLIIGMMVAVLPLMAIAVWGYATYHNQIAEPFRNVLNAQHRVLVPLERIQGELWDISVRAVEFSEDGSELEAIESTVALHLAQLEQAVEEYGHFRSILDGIDEDWAALVEAAALLQPGSEAAENASLQRFESVTRDVAYRLEALSENLRRESEQSHKEALAAMHRLETFAVVAAILTVLFAGTAIQIIDRALINSTDELVAGAMSITAGDRTREIDVQVPPELAAVANAFNVMTKQIILQENALAIAASTDSLTELHNRREFDRVVAAKILERAETGVGFALLMLDIDHFKLFNDGYGHPAGDEALKQVARTMSNAARAGDHNFRYGGEEFAIVLCDADAEDARTVADRMRLAIEEAGVTLPSGDRVPLTVSIGIVVPGANLSQTEIVALADRALYQAKAAGRNTVRFAATEG